jgi:proteasome lid subunit RPN8/RPN11
MSNQRSIRPSVLDAIYRHAREAFPDECCGYVVGTGPAASVVRCANRQNELHALDPEAFPRTAADGYQIDGRELLELVRSFDGEHPATIVYHSHPRGRAFFSDEDARAALLAGYPVDYLVIEIDDDRMCAAALFCLTAERTFEEIARFS